MNSIRVIYNENFFRDEPFILLSVVVISVLVMIVTLVLVRSEIRKRGMK